MTSLSGFARVCGKKSGGIKALYLTNCADLSAIELAEVTPATDPITFEKWWGTITMESGKVFKKYEFERGECELKEDSATENDSLKITHTIEFYLAKMSSESRDAIEEIANESACGMIAIAVDMNGSQWVIGYSSDYDKEFPLTLGSSSGTTGKLLTDKNGHTVTLVSEDAENARTYIGTIPLT